MVNILGINLSAFSQAEVLKKIADFLKEDGQHFIVTPNPEIILNAHQDEEFFYILNQASLSLPDGIGLKIAALIFGKKLPRVTGADTTISLLKMAANKRTKVMVLNWEKGLSQPAEIEMALEKKFPGLIFSVINISRDIYLRPEIINQINSFAPDILFNTLGFPYQEKLMYYNLKKLPTVKVALGIGGSFDFITEKIKRAPRFFRALGLEWLWRLGHAFNYQNSTQRIARIYRATFVFIAKVIKVGFINPFLYRKNVACFVFKKEGNKIKVLILERRDQAGHWQLPQGGTDGQEASIAGQREIFEETGLKKVKTIAIFKNIYRYSFPKIKKGQQFIGSRRYINDYKGQAQSLYIAELEDKNQEVKICFWDHINYQWVEPCELISRLHPYRRPGAEIFLKKFNSLKI